MTFTITALMVCRIVTGLVGTGLGLGGMAMVLTGENEHRGSMILPGFAMIALAGGLLYAGIAA